MLVYNPLTLSGVGFSPIIVPFNSPTILVGQLVGTEVVSLGLVCTVSPGAVLTYSVQVSGDQPNNFTNWNNHNILVNQSESQYSQVQFPVSGIRLACSAWTSGSINLGIVQWP